MHEAPQGLGDGGVPVHSVQHGHPNSTALLSFGSALLRQLLETVDQPDETVDGGVIARCSVARPQTWVGYYGRSESGVHRITTLSEVLAGTESGAYCLAFTPEHLPKARGEFVSAASKHEYDDTRASSFRRRAALTAREEECRRLLLDAAYIELARSANPELFDETPPADFSPDAVANLGRHGFPFAAALRAVDVKGLCPSPTDDGYRRLIAMRRDTLDRRFAGLTAKLEEALRELMSLRRSTRDGSPGDAALPTCMAATYAVRGRDV